MTLDEQVGLLREQKDAWSRRALFGFLQGPVYTGIGGSAIVSPFLVTLNKIANNVAFSATGGINYENADTFLRFPDILDMGGLLSGGMVFGLGVYGIVRGAMAQHEADKLADRIAEIENSPPYKAQATAQQKTG